VRYQCGGEAPLYLVVAPFATAFVWKASFEYDEAELRDAQFEPAAERKIFCLYMYTDSWKFGAHVHPTLAGQCLK
jgi:hypothetical protein